MVPAAKGTTKQSQLDLTSRTTPICASFAGDPWSSFLASLINNQNKVIALKKDTPIQDDQSPIHPLLTARHTMCKLFCNILDECKRGHSKGPGFALRSHESDEGSLKVLLLTGTHQQMATVHGAPKTVLTSPKEPHRERMRDKVMFTTKWGKIENPVSGGIGCGSKLVPQMKP